MLRSGRKMKQHLVNVVHLKKKWYLEFGKLDDLDQYELKKKKNYAFYMDLPDNTKKIVLYSITIPGSEIIVFIDLNL